MPAVIVMTKSPKSPRTLASGTGRRGGDTLKVKRNNCDRTSAYNPLRGVGHADETADLRHCVPNVSPQTAAA